MQTLLNYTLLKLTKIDTLGQKYAYATTLTKKGGRTQCFKMVAVEILPQETQIFKLNKKNYARS